MDKKKLIYRVAIVAVLVLGYFNYFADEKKIEKKEEVIETTGAVYDTDGYHIEAEKQKDFVKKNETTFEKAKALLGDMVLTGDNALLDAGKNLLLKTNILGKSLNGWEFKTEKINYDKDKDLVTSDVGVVAINKEEDIEVSGTNFSSDTKMDNLVLSGDVKFKTKDIVLSAENAKYNDNTKIMEILGDSYLSSENMEQGALGGSFKVLKYNTKTNMLTSNKPFTITYNDVKLYGENLVYNDKTEAFKITKNVHIEVDGYKIDMTNITSTGGDEIFFKGKIHGTNGINTFYGDNGVYNKATKMFYLKENVIGRNTDGAKLDADEAIYNTQLKILNIIGNNRNIVYRGKDDSIETKDLVYNTNTGDLNLNNDYKYTSKTYESSGKKFFYNKDSGEGYVIDGEMKDLGKGQFISGDKINFNRLKESYLINGNGYYEDNTYIFKSEKIDYNNIEKLINLPVAYTLERKKEKDIFKGLKGEYNSQSEIFKSFGGFTYESSENTITGDNLVFNGKTGLGKVEKDIVVINKKDNSKLTGNSGEFKENDYVKLQGNLKLIAEDMDVFATSGEYKINEKKIYIPGEITFKSEKKQSAGKMYDGIYNLETKIFSGENFTGKDVENTLKSDIIRYRMSDSVMVLEKNAEIVNPSGILTGDLLEYNEKTDIAKSLKKFKIKYTDYDIYGDTGTLNMKTNVLDAKDIKIVSKLGEEFKGNKVEGSMENMNLDFIGDVSGKIYQEGVPVTFKGDFVRAYFKKNKDGQLKAQRVEIRKNAEITKEDLTINSDYIEIQTDKKLVYGKDNSKIVMKDNKGVTTTVTSDIMSGNLNTEVLDLVGNVRIVRVDPKNTVITTSSKGKVKKKENVIELRGDVLVNNGESVIEADEVDYNTKTEKIKARGNVFVDYKNNKTK